MKFRHTNFMRLVYATLLALPFVSILSRVIYAQSNKNAYQSYEESQIISLKKINSIADLIVDYQYTIEYEEKNVVGSGNKFTYSDISINWSDYGNFQNELVKKFVTDYTTTYGNRIFLYDEQDQYLGAVTQWGNELKGFSFVFQARSGTAASFDGGNSKISYITYLKDTLDNVFEFSVNKFIQNNNFGKINLFQWTTDLFFDSNDVNNMYVGFINWYLNYTLLVSATYILFLVLMWFINYARRLLERGMNYDW